MSESKLPIYGLANPSAEHINAELHRAIRSGKEYDKYMPYSDCSSVKLADGDTKVAIDNMAVWGAKYKNHTTELSKLFKSKDLKNKCADIHSFLFNHFQYKIDTYNQNLRSPACSWKSRKNGIDCKSYSIFASTILRNLGVHHYLRRVKQGVNEGFTHVYVIVPENQKNPKDLSVCYCIDGTLPFKEEPTFFEKDDVFINASNGLGGLATESAIDQVKADAILTSYAILKPVLVSILTDFVSEYFACDVYDFDPQILDYNINKVLLPQLESELAGIDKALQYGSADMLEDHLNKLFKEFDLGEAELHHLIAYGGFDKNCLEGLQSVLTFVRRLKETVINKYYQNIKTDYADTYSFIEIKKEDFVNNRTFYFGIPIGSKYNSNTKASFQNFIIEPKGVKKFVISPTIPYGKGNISLEALVNKWENTVFNYMLTSYGSSKANQYRVEIKPHVKNIIALRKKLYFGASGIYILEDKHQTELYKIFMKYDKKYVDFLLNKAKRFRDKTQNDMKKLKAFIDENRKIIEQSETRKTIKKIVGFSLFGIALIFLLDKDR